MALDTVNALTSKVNVEEFLGAAVGQDSDFIINLINRVSWFINTYTNRKLLSRSLTEYYTVQSNRKITLKEFPVTIGESNEFHLYEDAGRSFGASSEWNSGDYWVDEDSGIVWLDSSIFSTTGGNVKITYTGGYSTIPYDLEQVCIELIAKLYKDKQSGRFDIISISGPDGSVTLFEKALTPLQKATLKRYRKIPCR